MLRLLKTKRGQSTAEYAIVIGLVVAAAVGMQTYVKRGLQARQKDAADEYVNTLSTDTNWATISSTTATLSGQYEHEKLSSQTTQQMLTGTEGTSTMDKEGTVTRDSIQKTKQAAGDYQKQDYTKE